jgi:hypothetical protein
MVLDKAMLSKHALNPIEYLWKSVKRVLSTGFVETLDDMKQKIVGAWNALSGQPSFEKHWIDVFWKAKVIIEIYAVNYKTLPYFPW